MKKMMFRIAGSLLAAVTVLSFASCSDEVVEATQLNAPEPTVTYRSESFELKWLAVEGADAYAYKLDGAAEQTTDRCTLTFAGLEYGSIHTVSIKSVSASGRYADSRWMSVKVDLNAARTLGALTLSVSDVTPDSFTVSWNSVPQAEFYEYSLDDGAVESGISVFKTFAGVTEGKHTVKVRPATSDADFVEADWTSIEVSTVIAADAAGRANCYMVESGTVYTFDASYKGNSSDERFGDVASVKLLWEDRRGLISELSLDGAEVRFGVSANTFGNAVIAVLDSENRIVWSWHVWVPEISVEGVQLKSGYTMMNINLGARNGKAADAGSYGMLYQWGRKDPFPTASTLTGDASTVGGPIYDADGNTVAITYTSAPAASVEEAVGNPMMCIASGSAGNDWLATPDDTLWGNPEGNVRDSENNTYPNKGEKSVYDPCPAGWRVPPADAFRSFTSSGGYAWTIDTFDVADYNGDGVVDENDWNYGWHFNTAAGKSNYFPAAGRYYGAYGMLYGSVVGYWGNYWGNTPNNKYGFCVLAFQISPAITCSPAGGAARSDAFSVRCIADR